MDLVNNKDTDGRLIGVYVFRIVHTSNLFYFIIHSHCLVFKTFIVLTNKTVVHIGSLQTLILCKPKISHCLDWNAIIDIS